MDIESKHYEHKAQYYETDQMGIIHHSNYIRWFEEARTNLLDSIGFGYDQMEESGIIIPVLAIHCDYKSMVYYNQTVYIIPVVDFFNGVKLTISYQVIDKLSGELRATGISKHCFLNSHHRPVSLKKINKPIYDLFERLLKKDSFTH
ncbi:acyl-CoA thioester hydrolase [Carnobacterium iners]|uniref:Acyl-CoA thioester hydrolase n=1 Tax=Carnobacterium iners TaxID=1073423 RepID=A0A1X7N1T3_9LACT|nr:acyl-CoA thioesterase [Carnobacterium iners]SEK96333.1 acyl-CoA thioester hydrolase [Carnobacterium iners]SMH31229.1 acyl-CoA thioester hydrolase [Carnobacterium iners]